MFRLKFFGGVLTLTFLVCLGVKILTIFERIPFLEGQLIQLVTNDPNLKGVLVMSQNIGDDVAKMIALALRGNTSLNRLILINNQIGDDGAIALANSLEGNSSLEKLFLSENNIGDDGAIALATAFEGNTSLEVLSISHNQFGDNGAQALNNAFAIQRNQQLNHPPRRSGCTVS